MRPRATAEDREPLRALLGWRFESHARVVSSMLALQPGLRFGVTVDDPLTSLVALRGYLSGGEPPVTTPLVDAVLRDGVRREADHGLAMVARCACAGLARLPAVVGPVRRPAMVDPAVLAFYQPGRQLVEPGFLEVSTTPWRVPEQTAEYVIWASTARRTDALGTEQAPGETRPPGRALFPAGTRFVVLAVDPAADATADATADAADAAEKTADKPLGHVPGNASGNAADRPAGGAMGLVRVLLREVVGGRTDTATERRVLGRLREALAARPDDRLDASAGVGPHRIGLAVGLDDAGHPYALDGGRPVDEGELAGMA